MLSLSQDERTQCHPRPPLSGTGLHRFMAGKHSHATTQSPLPDKQIRKAVRALLNHPAVRIHSLEFLAPAWQLSGIAARNLEIPQSAIAAIPAKLCCIEGCLRYPCRLHSRDFGLSSCLLARSLLPLLLLLSGSYNHKRSLAASQYVLSHSRFPPSLRMNMLLSYYALLCAETMAERRRLSPQRLKDGRHT